MHIKIYVCSGEIPFQMDVCDVYAVYSSCWIASFAQL